MDIVFLSTKYDSSFNMGIGHVYKIKRKPNFYGKPGFVIFVVDLDLPVSCDFKSLP
jgi:hypothetical protein